MQKVQRFLFAIIGATVLLTAQAELIVLSAAQTDDPYYTDAADNIFAFHIAFAEKIIEHGDQVLILTDARQYETYVDALGSAHVATIPMLDIWMRDFSPVNSQPPILFRYTAAGQGGSQQDADFVQDAFALFIENAQLAFEYTDLLNDGGNFVEDDAGNIVVSTKFLSDNALDEARARQTIRALTGARHVAFIESDEQGGLEHADGVISFIDTNTILINDYAEHPEYMRALKNDLRRSLPNVTIHTVITPYDGSNIYDAAFGSACGLYTNALVTPERIYVPQFDIPEDAIAIAQIQAATTRTVIPVSAAGVCRMGGGVRCMSWQLRGENAKKLLHYVQQYTHTTHPL